ncbi:hypothetical protein GCM10027277_57670 [Pseudoduganella ginsengisoli]|uniref:Relaxase/mobilization nuclease domain-containing protein n=1 Tax=Pseudoduganella ginsengisoli TaxID=1462440 RepID=A0A6L6Q8T4_9BURK|nr:TraI/MobA(P) family conjugative relaxase [Pseudoduganella ginsengisoli]MTW05869.1 relaxase/mobilization nuclease domain-containing protein [Pseudoduganella ginsengisoli]
MIVKHVAMKTVQKSSFVELTKYITSAQDKQERVGQVTVTNCHQRDPLDAALEVYATQAQNKRATSDKTYHIIISFRVGEHPSDQALKEIEQKVCASLGYADHQRISAVHHDTDNLHIHVAINKIHPTRLTIHTPYFDHLKFGPLCERLELEYGLERDNHQVRKTSSEARAADMENMAGIESLLGWIKRECLPELRQANSWSEFNQVLTNNGLEIQKRGNGFIVTDNNGTAVKASSIARELSKEKLETRFGLFEPPPKAGIAGMKQAGNGTVLKKPIGKVGKAPPPAGLRHPDTIGKIGVLHLDSGKRYEPRPVKTRYDTSTLFARYMEQQDGFYADKKHGMQAASAERLKALEDAKRGAKLKRAAIKLLGESAPVKRALYAMTHKKLLADIKKIRADHQRIKADIANRTRRQSWNDWLQAQAKAGDQEALAALRARDAKREPRRNSLTTPTSASVLDGIKLDNVTKKGTVIYRDGSTSIRDDGDRLKVAKGSGDQALETALKLAIVKYGPCIKVNGSDEFKERIAQVAAASKLNISFDDAKLEKRRQFLLATQQKQEKTDVSRHDQPTGRTQPSGHSTGRRGPGFSDARQPIARRFAGGGSRGDVRTTGQPGRAGLAGSAGDLGGSANRPAKPGIGKIGFFPPPPDRKRLRNVSQLGVVRIAGGSEVLLPRDVHPHMGNQGAEPHNGVRRSVFGTGGVSDPKTAAMNKYVAERESKRANGFDITKHASYNGERIQEATYGGLRNVDGQNLALVKSDDQISVVPVDEKTAQRLSRMKLGEPLSVSGGSIKKRGRSR